MNDIGRWDIHPLFKLPLHRGKCHICDEYRNHVFAMEKEDGHRVVEEMAQLWESQEVGAMRQENKTLREEVNSGRAELERLKRLLEVERSRSADQRRSRSPNWSRESTGRVSQQQDTGSILDGPTETMPTSSIIKSQPLSEPNTVPPRRRAGDAIVAFYSWGVRILRIGLIPNTVDIEVRELGRGQQWSIGQHIILIGDSTGDGLGDIIAFGDTGVYVARNNGESFDPSSLILDDFVSSKGWYVAAWNRQVADLRGKGYVDIIGFANQGAVVALNNGDGTYAPARRVLSSFGDHAEGLNLSQHLLFLADVTGNGIPDIVFFGDRDVTVALGAGDGTFSPPKVAISGKFTCYGEGWRGEKHPRFAVDLTGDGRADIIGFADHGVCVALNNGDGTFQAPKLVLKDFGAVAGGWWAEENPRFVVDITGDGRKDIVGFGRAGVYAARGNGDGTFQNPTLVCDGFGSSASDGGWRVDRHPRFLVDLTGNGAADIIGFGDDAVYVSYNDGSSFGDLQRLTKDFSYTSETDVRNMVRFIANLWPGTF